LSFRCDRERYRETVRFGDLKSELQQLTVDARSAPGVLAGHGLDGRSNIEGGYRPSDQLASGPKAPVQTEAFPMPAHYGVRLYDQYRFAPVWPQSAQCDPEQSVGIAQTWPFGAALQHNQLLPQGHDLKPRSERDRTQLLNQVNSTSISQSMNSTLYQHQRLNCLDVLTNSILATYKCTSMPTFVRTADTDTIQDFCDNVYSRHANGALRKKSLAAADRVRPRAVADHR